MQLTLPWSPAALQKPILKKPDISGLSGYKVALDNPYQLCLSLSAHAYTIFTDMSNARKKQKLLQLNALVPVKKAEVSGILSRQSTSKLMRAMGWLSLRCQPKRIYNREGGYYFFSSMSFITLTLSGSQKHTDSFIRQKMLARFIDVLLKRYPGLAYVWKAEAQQNGNIHFHIATDHFIPHRYVRLIWNKRQKEYGYLDAYAKEHGHFYAPSTEVRSARSKGEIAVYLRKYMAKKPGKHSIPQIQAKIRNRKNTLARPKYKGYRPTIVKQLAYWSYQLKEATKRKIRGKLWGCSSELLLKPYSCPFDACNESDKQLLEGSRCVVQNEYFAVYPIVQLSATIRQLSKYIGGAIVEHLQPLFRRIQPVIDLFDSENNYRYQLSPIASG